MGVYHTLGTEDDIRAFTRFMLLFAVRVTMDDIVAEYCRTRAPQEIHGKHIRENVVQKNAMLELDAQIQNKYLRVLKEGDRTCYVLNHEGRLHLTAAIYNELVNGSSPILGWKDS
jgi:hypothetical protein